MRQYRALIRLVRPTAIVPISRDPDDDQVLACALAADADLIVSRDRDLPPGTLRAVQRDLTTVLGGRMVEPMKRHRYRVVYELDESGRWIATVPRVKGCHTYGRSIEQARARIREALALFVRQAGTVHLVDDVRLPVVAASAVAAGRAARVRVEREQKRAKVALARAVSKLERLGLSTRDTGEVLGLSQQRVHQIRE